MKKLNIVLSTSVALLLISCASPKPGTPEFVQKKEEDQQKTDFDQRIGDWQSVSKSKIKPVTKVINEYKTFKDGRELTFKNLLQK